MTRSRDKSGRRRYEDRDNDFNKGSDTDPDWQKDGLEYYKCERCLRKFTRKCSYLRHQKDAVDCRLARERDLGDLDDFPINKRARKDLNSSRFPESEDSDDSEDDWPVKCILCETPFKTVDELSKHIETDHNENENATPSEESPPKISEPKRQKVKESKPIETKPVREDYSEMIDFELPLAKYSQVPIRMPKKFQKAKIRAKEIDMEFGEEEKPKFVPKFKISVKETKGAVTPTPSKNPQGNENKSPIIQSDVKSPTGRKPAISPTIKDNEELDAPENDENSAINNENSTVNNENSEDQPEKDPDDKTTENGKEDDMLDAVLKELGCDNEQESATKALTEAASFLDDIDLNVTKTSQSVVNEEEDVNLDDYFDTRRSLPSPPVPQPILSKHSNVPASSVFTLQAHTYAKGASLPGLSTTLKDLIKRRPKKMNFTAPASKYGQMPALRFALNNPNLQVRVKTPNAPKLSSRAKKTMPRLIRPPIPISSDTSNLVDPPQPNQGTSPNLTNIERKVYKPATPGSSIKIGDTLITRKSLPQIISNEILPPNHNLLKGILNPASGNKINLSCGNLYFNTSAGPSVVVVRSSESPKASTPNQMHINRPVNVLSGNNSVNYSTPSPVSRNDNAIAATVNRLPALSQLGNQKPGVVVLRTPGAVSQGALPNITLRNNAVVHNESPPYTPTALQPPPPLTLVSSSPQTPTSQYFTNTYARPVQSMLGNMTPYSTASPILYYTSNTIQSQPQATNQFYHNQGNGFTHIRTASPSYIVSSPTQQSTSYAYTPVYSSPSNITVRNFSPNAVIRNASPNMNARVPAGHPSVTRKIAPKKVMTSGTASIPPYSNSTQLALDNPPVQVVLKLIRCPKCPKTFATKSGFTHHYKKNHTQIEQIPTLPQARSPPQYQPSEVIEIDDNNDRYSPEKTYLPPASSPMHRPPPQQQHYVYSHHGAESPQRTTPLSNMPSQPIENQAPLQDHAYAYQGQTIDTSPPQNSPSALVDAEEYIQKLIMSKQKLAAQLQKNDDIQGTGSITGSIPTNVQNSLNDENVKQFEARPATMGCAAEIANNANDDVIETIVID